MRVEKTQAQVHGRRVVVLTNAMRPMLRHGRALKALTVFAGVRNSAV